MGLGFRYLNDDAGGRQSSTGAFAYQRISRYFYAPLGIEMANQLSSNLLLGAMTEFDIFLWGRQSSNLSDVDPSFPDLQNDQEKGFGLRGSFKFVFQNEKTNYIVEPFVRYWHIKNSNLNSFGLEPDNNTTEYGVKLGAQF